MTNREHRRLSVNAKPKHPAWSLLSLSSLDTRRLSLSWNLRLFLKIEVGSSITLFSLRFFLILGFVDLLSSPFLWHFSRILLLLFISKQNWEFGIASTMWRQFSLLLQATVWCMTENYWLLVPKKQLWGCGKPYF